MIILIIVLCIIFTSIYAAINYDAMLYIKRNNDIAETIELKDQFQILEIPHFLSNQECQDIINYTDSDVLTETLGFKRNHFTNKTRWADINDKKLNDLINHRITSILISRNDPNINKYYFENLEIVKYNPNIDPNIDTETITDNSHYDVCNGFKWYCDKYDGVYGKRHISIVVYLNDDYTGGETEFPLILKKIIPQKGKAILFYNTLYSNSKEYVIKESLHRGNPVYNSNKYVLLKWLRTTFKKVEQNY